MSTTLTTRRQQPTTTSTTSKRSSDTSTTTSQQSSTATTTARPSSLDTSSTTSSVTILSSDSVIGATPSSTFSAKCSTDRDCGSSKICSKGACAKVIDGAPFGPDGASTTSHMSPGAATALGLGVMSFILLLLGLGIWLWRRKVQKIPSFTIETAPVNRNRSVSSATDQKTLVASVPNSPQYANFREHYDQTHTASLAQLVSSNKIAAYRENVDAADEKRRSTRETTRQRSGSTQKRLPRPPRDMPLPPPPATTEKKYTVNVNINKSMIFDDVMYNMASTPRDTGTPHESATPRDRTKYRFEEYHPPIKSTPPISVRQLSSKRSSEIELAPYPRKTSVSTTPSVGDEGDDAETRLKRKSTLKKLQSRPPQLNLSELTLSPPSPSFSFKSYDWYQDIIGTEQTNLEDATLAASAPSIPDRSPRRSPTRPDFSAAPAPTSSEPPIPNRNPNRELERGLLPAPLSPRPVSPASPSWLSPNANRTPSPTSTSYQLAPAVYVRPTKPARASLRSSVSQKPHMSRSWVPAEGLYLPEEGTQDSYTMYKRRISDDSRPTSYSPF